MNAFMAFGFFAIESSFATMPQDSMGRPFSAKPTKPDGRFFAAIARKNGTGPITPSPRPDR